MSDLTPKGFSNGEYVNRFLLRDKLYEEDAITMGGVAILNNFPAADVVPVVRCKHCRWAVFTPYGKAYGCRLLSTKPNYLLGITEDFFCAYGERMDMVTECNHVKDGDGE